MKENKPKTIDEFFIEKYQKLEKENKQLEESLEINYKREGELIQERDEWKNKYHELVDKLKEDFKPEIWEIDGKETYFRFRDIFIRENNKEKDKYYIELFNLTEENEEE